MSVTQIQLCQACLLHLLVAPHASADQALNLRCVLQPQNARLLHFWGRCQQQRNKHICPGPFALPPSALLRAAAGTRVLQG